MFECEATYSKQTKNYKVYELDVDDEILPNKFYIHKSLFEPGNSGLGELAEGEKQEIRIKLITPEPSTELPEGYEHPDDEG